MNKSKNITVDAEILDMLNAVRDDLEKKFGFRPTHSQTLRWLIRGRITNVSASGKGA